LHDALVWLGFLTEAEIAAQPRWSDWLGELAAAKRAGHLDVAVATLWMSAERAAQFRALWPQATIEPDITAPASRDARVWSREDALVEIIRGRLEGLGPGRGGRTSRAARFNSKRAGSAACEA
jgi:ATP-dependent Lhr-like helicase